LLSPRKLYYCATQLYWRCDHIAASEDGLLGTESAPEGYTDPFAPNFNLGPHAPEFVEDINRYWYVTLMSHEYSTREITYERDRLVAVSGLARRAAYVMKGRYLAGLWESSVICGLHWTAQAASRTKTDDVPSWSWASQQGGFSYDVWKWDRVSISTYVGAYMSLINQDCFSGVIDTRLTLRGKFLPATPKEGGYVLPLLQNTLLTGLNWDDHRFNATGIRIMALLLSVERDGSLVHLLLVTTSASDSGKYVRVGIGSAVMNALQFSAMVDLIPETEIILI
jgi:hypothetical protein